MEMGNFKGMWKILTKIKEIKPFKAKGWSKDNFYNELIAKKVIKDCNILDPYESDASRCIYDWNRFQRTNQIEYALNIVKHNINCLLKESVILNHKKYFLDNYHINEKGWLIDRWHTLFRVHIRCNNDYNVLFRLANEKVSNIEGDIEMIYKCKQCFYESNNPDIQERGCPNCDGCDWDLVRANHKVPL